MPPVGAVSSQRLGFSSFAAPASWWDVAFQELLRPPLGKVRPSQEQWGVEAVAFPSGRPALLPRALEESALPLVRKDVVLQRWGADGSCCPLGLGMMEGPDCALGANWGGTCWAPGDANPSIRPGMGITLPLMPALSEAAET